MALLCGRVASNQIIYSMKGIPSVLVAGNHVQVNKAKMTLVKLDPAKIETAKGDHDEKNMRLNRPMSPHLTIYAPEITSMLSITHRITGVVLSGYVAILGCGALLLPGDINHYATMIESLELSCATIFAAKFIIAAPFGYHTANGIRHLNWDTGRSVTKQGVKTTGYIMLGAAAFLTAVLASL